MKAASVSEIKQELKEKPSPQLIELCLRLARYKKENKELLTYLLFEAHDVEAYIVNVKEEMNESFSEINKANLYFAKKSLRKILRTAAKYIRYTGSKVVEVELLLHFCLNLKNSKIPYHKSAALVNIFIAQVKKIDVAIASMHEDLQYEYNKQREELSEN